MKNSTIPSFGPAVTLDGTEPVETVQSSASVKTSTAGIAALERLDAHGWFAHRL